jgi:virginiamycin B lyase
MRTPAVLSSALAALIAGHSYAQGNLPPGIDLPAGAGKSIVMDHCLRCHDATRLPAPGHTRSGWSNVISQMINIGTDLPQSDIAPLTDYLVANFPQLPPAPAKIIPGQAQVSFQEWAVATEGAFPHDPLATRDGAVWYAGQHGSLLGRIDPTTGAIKEYRTTIADSGPHGLTADLAGNIWFTANYKGYIGELNPKTGEVTAYKLNDARDPHTPVFDQKGVLWFTVQGANKIGRLIPSTGEVKLVDVPTAHALPYGIVISSTGVPYFAEFGTHKLASVDPSTMAIREYELPNPNTRPRRIAITSDDVLWYTDYSRGFLGRYDPKTGAGKEWPSPGGSNSEPYAITALHDIIWYCETNVKPNTLVRFDPRSEKFQSWSIPSGGDVVRNMMPTYSGGLVLAESGAGKVARVTVQ